MFSLHWIGLSGYVLQEHIAISREVEKRHKININADEIRKVYFKFGRSLVDLDDQFKCCLCGYHPFILIVDVIHKCAFKMPHCKNVEGKMFNEIVDVEMLWSNVSKFCINDHDDNGERNKVIPSLSFCINDHDDNGERNKVIPSLSFCINDHDDNGERNKVIPSLSFCINDHDDNGERNKVIPSLSFWDPWIPKETHTY